MRREVLHVARLYIIPALWCSRRRTLMYALASKRNLPRGGTPRLLGEQLKAIINLPARRHCSEI
jgi:hypothetical protein